VGKQKYGITFNRYGRKGTGRSWVGGLKGFPNKNARWPSKEKARNSHAFKRLKRYDQWDKQNKWRPRIKKIPKGK